jgi:hypothetical protein
MAERHGAANRAGLGLIGLRRFPIVAHRLKPNFGLHLKDLKQRLSLQQQIGIMNGPRRVHGGNTLFMNWCMSTLSESKQRISRDKTGQAYFGRIGSCQRNFLISAEFPDFGDSWGEMAFRQKLPKRIL